MESEKIKTIIIIRSYTTFYLKIDFNYSIRSIVGNKYMRRHTGVAKTKSMPYSPILA